MDEHEVQKRARQAVWGIDQITHEFEALEAQGALDALDAAGRGSVLAFLEGLSVLRAAAVVEGRVPAAASDQYPYDDLEAQRFWRQATPAQQAKAREIIVGLALDDVTADFLAARLVELADITRAERGVATEITEVDDGDAEV